MSRRRFKEKWINIRDNYTRFLNETRKTKSGSEAKSVQKYTYADILSLLAPVIKKRKLVNSTKSTILYFSF